MVDVADLLARIHVNRTWLSDDPVALGALASWGDLRIKLAGVQGPQHGDVGQHNDADTLWLLSAAASWRC
jgi:hypothetical protein